MPAGVFSNQIYLFWQILEGLRIENFGIFYGHFEYFTAIWYILWPFGIVVIIWYTFPVLVFCAMKNLATLATTCACFFPPAEKFASS
jgi:hypothetical protein